MTGNHWHSIGFPVDGSIFLYAEEAVFVLSVGQASFRASENEPWSESIDAMLAFLVPSHLTPNSLRAYLSLKKLGYILWRPENVYLEEALRKTAQTLRSDYVVFKPNSRFQKKSPSGLLFVLKLVRAGMSVAEAMSSLCSPNGTPFTLAIADETGQVYLNTKQANNKFSC